MRGNVAVLSAEPSGGIVSHMRLDDNLVLGTAKQHFG
jgi:hypothetical protein